MIAKTKDVRKNTAIAYKASRAMMAMCAIIIGGLLFLHRFNESRSQCLSIKHTHIQIHPRTGGMDVQITPFASIYLLTRFNTQKKYVHTKRVQERNWNDLSFISYFICAIALNGLPTAAFNIESQHFSSLSLYRPYIVVLFRFENTCKAFTHTRQLPFRMANIKWKCI